MLRLARLLRGRKLSIPVNRDGVPFGWERPDPPPPVYYEHNKRLDHIEQMFFWTDAVMPIFMISNPEIYEGGIIDAAPRAFTMFLIFLGSAAVLGSFGLIFQKHCGGRTTVHISYDRIKKIQTSKKEHKEMTILKSMKDNPLKVNVWPESYPHSHSGVVKQFEGHQNQQKSYQLIKQINQECLDYLNAKIEESRKKVLATERGEGHAGHGESHAGHGKSHTLASHH